MMNKFCHLGAMLGLCVLFSLVTLSGVGLVGDARAYDGYGAGGTGVSTQCDTYPHAIRIWCDGDSGGASWHIYKVEYPPNNNGPRYDENLVFLRDGGYDKLLPGSCAGTDYYIAYAFDGRDGVSGPFATYGPIRHPYYFQSGRSPQYNGYVEGTADTWQTVKNAIKDGVNVNAWRLSELAASQAHKEMTGTSTISEGTGYFCAPPTKEVTLSGLAINLDTKKPIGHDNPEPADVVVGKPASITAKNIEGYEFAFWSKDGPDKTNPTQAGFNKTYTVNKMKEDLTVYAYYKPKKTDFLGQSNVSFRSSSYATDAPNDYSASGINPVGLGKVTAEASNSANICIGNDTKTNLTFSHSVFASENNGKTTTAKVVNNFNLTGDGYSITPAGSSSQSASFANRGPHDMKISSSKQNPNYFDVFMANGTKYTDGGGNKYFLRDYGEVTFSKKGTYKFCETLYINGVDVSEACANITVTDKNCGEPTTPPPVVPSDCGAWTPSSYTSSDSEDGVTSVVSKVKNNDVSDMRDWADSVYAKPQDNVEWIHCYYPGVQEAAFTSVTTNNSHPHPNYDNTLSYSAFSDFGVWQNKYTISTSATNHNRTASFRTPKVPGSVTEYREIGDSTAVMFNDSSYNVAYKREGDNLIETNTPGSPVKASVTHKSCSWDCNCTTCCSGEGESRTCTTCCDTCTHKSPGYIKSERTASSSEYASSATVMVPYNFENSTTVTTPSNTILYAGEEYTFNFSITTSPISNDTTQGIYATRVPNASWWLTIGPEGGSTSTTQAVNGSLNEGSDPNGTTVGKQITVNIPDLPAGSRVCVSSGVSPHITASDGKDMTGGSGSTSSSDVCYTIAKRPSIEIWGGNIYSSGLIKTSTAVKKHLAAFPDYPYRVEGNKYGYFLYGSWNDSGIIASGGVEGFSSGATLGGLDLYGKSYPSPWSGVDNNDPLVEQPGGGKDNTQFCPERVPLTVSNNCGGTGSVGDNEMIVGAIQGDKDLVESRYKYTIEEAALSGTINLGNTSIAADKPKGDGVLYYYGGSNNLTIGGYVMNDALVRVVRTTGNVTIDGDLKYGGEYGTFEEMPKLVVYSDKDIKIDCGVKRIDALLIAGGKVTTCDNANDSITYTTHSGVYHASSNANDPKRSNQLIINGAVLANVLVPGRTYGAATGANSVVPAEIISFDPSLYLWSGGNRGTATSDGGGTASEMMLEGSRSLNVTYQKELAPRL